MQWVSTRYSSRLSFLPEPVPNGIAVALTFQLAIHRVYLSYGLILLLITIVMCLFQLAIHRVYLSYVPAR